jgi:hypothetical protein
MHRHVSGWHSLLTQTSGLHDEEYRICDTANLDHCILFELPDTEIPETHLSFQLATKACKYIH